MAISQDSTATLGNHPTTITLTIQLKDTEARFIQSVVQTAMRLYRNTHGKAAKDSDEALPAEERKR